MKKIFLALMVVFAIAMVGTFAGCDGPVNTNPKEDPDAPENGRYVPPELAGDTSYSTPRVPAPVRYMMAK